MTVNDLARAGEVSANTIRHYTKIGLLSPRRDPVNRYRCYVANDLKRIVFIRAAQSLGFKLGEVNEILTDSDAGRSPCPRVRELMEKRIAESQARLQELATLHGRMEAAYAAWGSMPDGGGSDTVICPLIEAVGDPLHASDGRG